MGWSRCKNHSSGVWDSVVCSAAMVTLAILVLDTLPRCIRRYLSHKLLHIAILWYFCQIQGEYRQWNNLPHHTFWPGFAPNSPGGSRCKIYSGGNLICELYPAANCGYDTRRCLLLYESGALADKIQFIRHRRMRCGGSSVFWCLRLIFGSHWVMK